MAQQLLPLKPDQDVPNSRASFPIYYLFQVLIVLTVALVVSFSGNSSVSILIAVIYASALLLFGWKAPWLMLMITLLLGSLSGVFSGIPLAGVGSFSFGTVINGSAFAGTLISLFLYGRRLRWEMIKPYRWFVIFALWSVLGIMTAPVFSVAMKDIVLFWIPVLIAVLTRLITNQFPKNIKRIEGYLLFLNIFPLLIIATGFMFEFVRFTARGFEGFFSSRILSLYLFIPLSLALSWWRLGSSVKERRWGFFWAVVLMFVILIGLSRTVIAAAICIFLLRFFPPRRIAHWFFIFSMGLILFVVLLQVPQFRARFFFQGQDINSAIDWTTFNTNGRDNLWPAVFEDAMKSPIIGRGTGSSRVLSLQVSPLDHPHNDYLRVFHDLGLIGLTIFLIAWGGRLMRDWQLWVRLEKNSPSVAKLRMASFLGALGVAISFITDNTITYSFVLIPLFTLFALTDAAQFQESERESV